MYQQEFKAAVTRSKSFNLIIPEMEYTSEILLTKEKLALFPYAIRDAVGDIEIEEIVAQCLAIHFRLREPIEKIFGCQVYFTIGYVETEGQHLFYQSEEDLKKIILNGIDGLSINIHAWLTLPSMEILDMSLPTTYAILKKIDEGIGGVISSHPDKLTRGLKYHPMLVGEDFLRKTGLLIEFGY